MRQIDEMTPQEIETLHLKGMLAKPWRHPITGETREEIHAKRTKYTPQISANHCPNCGRKLSDCNGNCIFDDWDEKREHDNDLEHESRVAEAQRDMEGDLC